MSNRSVILLSLQKHNNAEISWAITVARATPLTPMPSLATNTRSRMMLTTVDTSR